METSINENISNILYEIGLYYEIAEEEEKDVEEKNKIKQRKKTFLNNCSN